MTCSAGGMGQKRCIREVKAAVKRGYVEFREAA